MADLVKTALGYDVVRGKVKKVLDGDRFVLSVTEVAADNSDQYDKLEKIVVESLSVEEESSPGEERGAPELTAGEQSVPDDPALLDEMTGEELYGTPEESAQESGKANPVEYYRIRTKEDLEARLKNKMVDCAVRDRDSQGRLICDVTVL